MFRGIYTNVELKNAEKYGLEIRKVYSMVFYRQKYKYFEKYMKDIWAMRQKFNTKCLKALNKECLSCAFKGKEKECDLFAQNPDENKAMDTMTKKTGNSTYGKLAQKIFEFSFAGRSEDLPDEILEKIKSGQLTPIYKEHDNEEYVFVNSDKKVDTKHTFVCIPSFVTAYARIKLLERMKKYEKDMVYVDTDSTKILAGKYPMDSGDDLGEFGYEYRETEYFYAPKNYISRDKIQKNKDTGEMEQKRKIKGITKRAKLTKDDKETGIMAFEMSTPVKFKGSIRRDKVIARWETNTKEVYMYDNKRNWYGEKFYGKGIRSEPFIIEHDNIIEILMISSE